MVYYHMNKKAFIFMEALVIIIIVIVLIDILLLSLNLYEHYKENESHFFKHDRYNIEELFKALDE